MSLWDWLLPYFGNDSAAPTGGRKVTWTDPREVVAQGGRHGEVIVGCSACWRRASKCSCEVPR